MFVLHITGDSKTYYLAYICCVCLRSQINAGDIMVTQVDKKQHGTLKDYYLRAKMESLIVRDWIKVYQQN